MEQYKQLIRTVQQKGTHKPAAREGMPGTTSLFGYQFRHDLADGFPAITTKQLYWKGVVVELVWFLNGDTNIKFLDDNGVRKMWHEDAYNYYKKIASKNTDSSWNAIYMAINEEGERENWTDQTKAVDFSMFTFDEFCQIIRDNTLDKLKQFYSLHNYTLGDCGMQYGRLWRNWEGVNRNVVQVINTDLTASQFQEFNDQWNKALQSDPQLIVVSSGVEIKPVYDRFDQITTLIKDLLNSPMGRRHIISAWNVATLDDMALNACHALAQWNCRPLTLKQRIELAGYTEDDWNDVIEKGLEYEALDHIPEYILDCQMYQRSADLFLGVPLNIASYALLTEILCKVCNMLPGEMIYTYGDVHIYDNHKEQVELQLTRECRPLPKLKFSESFNTHLIQWRLGDVFSLSEMISTLDHTWFELEDYDPHPAIVGKLSTGLK